MADDFNILDGSYAGVRAYRTANQSIATATYTAIAFTAESFDTDTFHDNSTNNTRFTVTTAGKYRITPAVRWTSNTTGFRVVAVRKNGVATNLLHSSSPGLAQNHSQTGSVTLDLAANDYVEVYVYQDSGGNLSVIGDADGGMTYVELDFLGV